MGRVHQPRSKWTIFELALLATVAAYGLLGLLTGTEFPGGSNNGLIVIAFGGGSGAFAAAMRGALRAVFTEHVVLLTFRVPDTNPFPGLKTSLPAEVSDIRITAGVARSRRTGGSGSTRRTVFDLAQSTSMDSVQKAYMDAIVVAAV